MTKSDICKRRNCVIKVGDSFEKNAMSTTALTNISSEDVLDLGVLNPIFTEEFLSNNLPNLIFLTSEEIPLNKLSSQYGSDSVYEAVSSLNFYFTREDVNLLVTAENHPILTERIESGFVFSPNEVAEFIIEYGYTPISLKNATSIVSVKLVNELEAFYTGNFSSSTIGSFCALLPSVFGAVGTFFTLLNTAQDIINKLKNFSLNFSLKSLINNLKENVLKIIDKVVEKVKNIIENFSISNLITQVTSLVQNKIIRKFHEIKELALRFFDPTNIENFKKRIGILIDYVVNIFKNPTIEEIQFILFRFCKLAAIIESSILSLKNPVESYVASYESTVTILRSNSNINTARAIQAGALRYEGNAKNSGISETNENFIGAGNISEPSTEEVSGITPWNNGNGDHRIGFVGETTSAAWRWEQVNNDVRARIMRVQKNFGERLLILSGKRSNEEQRFIYNRELNKLLNQGVGEAEAKRRLRSRVATPGSSLHESGQALDIKWAGFPSRKEEFIRLSREAGFTGIGRNYSSFVHVDRGPERQW